MSVERPVSLRRSSQNMTEPRRRKPAGLLSAGRFRDNVIFQPFDNSSGIVFLGIGKRLGPRRRRVLRPRWQVRGAFFRGAHIKPTISVERDPELSLRVYKGRLFSRSVEQ